MTVATTVASPERHASAPRRDERDLRTGGAWSPLQRAKNDVIWLGATLALVACRLLPLSALQRLGRALGFVAHTVARSARRTALANVALVFPGLSPGERRALVRRSFTTLGQGLGEAVASLNAGPNSGGLPPIPLSAEARAVIDEARAEGRGILFVSAHLGPWERVAASLVAAGVPLVTIARESYDPRFTFLYERLRGNNGVGIVWRSGPAAARRMLRVLRSGGVLGVPMDLRSRVASCEAPFLGHPAPTAVGPARMALRTRAAVIVGTVAPCPAAGGGYHAELVVTATRIPIGDLAGRENVDEDAQRLTIRVNIELSRRIVAVPHAWVWMHERWTRRDHV